MQNLPNWEKVCRRIVDGDGKMHQKCVRELSGLDESLSEEEEVGFFQTEMGHYVVGGVAALIAIWAYSRISAAKAQASR